VPGCVDLEAAVPASRASGAWLGDSLLKTGHSYDHLMADEQALVARARKVRRALRTGADLASVDPRSTPGLPRSGDKAWARAQMAELGPLLAGHQERLYAAAAAGTDRRRMLLILQALDCGGKDGTIKAVVGALDPQGVGITAFAAPTPEELGHHFLWRVTRALPTAGFVGVFNRSHYEDVLAARVRGLVEPVVWRRRYDEINDFERAQAADGTVIIKVMLHISYEEQRARLQARLDDPTKRWKFRVGDLDDRDRWADYQRAYQEAVTRCVAPHAPWYVVPADHKWYRDWAVANILLAHLEELKLTYPEVDLDLPRLRQRLAAPANNR
jgi:PPK2 family polyphosphate:nucleotide phosphotransferase